ncbi:hypothetical protein Pmani_010211 [Petrolisthes manimaculis]|uniref:Uncharacterized protein n=1 Tax=Petrolisthes manimaculis TaxID=1843537 RepID=A0AAE1Q2J2_9EUCA|nr:hypothetical protein Pmani_010211 [Petrolisthes manimaculis]
MAYSGPATLAEVEADLNLSEEEDIADKHWPPLKLHSQMPGPTPWQPQVNTSYSASHPTTSTSSKRPLERVIGLVPAQPPTPGTSSGSVSSMTTTSSVSRRPKGKLR